MSIVAIHCDGVEKRPVSLERVVGPGEASWRFRGGGGNPEARVNSARLTLCLKLLKIHRVIPIEYSLRESIRSKKSIEGFDGLRQTDAIEVPYAESFGSIQNGSS